MSGTPRYVRPTHLVAFTLGWAVVLLGPCGGERPQPPGSFSVSAATLADSVVVAWPALANVDSFRADLSGDVTTAAVIQYYDAKDFDEILAVINLVALGGNGVEAFSIYAADDDSGTNATAIKTHASPTTADAAGDKLVLECTAAEIAQLSEAGGYTLRYVGIYVECHHASDNVLGTLILGGATFKRRALTADVVA